MESDTHRPAHGAPLTLFLSYSRADRAVAGQLAERLGQAGHTIWWDALIEGGANFSRSIREALDTADVVIVLWSDSAVESDWVRDEAAQGRDRHRLVPLSVDGSQPPLGFRQYQVIDVSRWRGDPAAPEMTAILRAVALSAGQVIGDNVRKGDVIGYVGCTGRCFGDHVHFEVWVNGVDRNPLGYLEPR